MPLTALIIDDEPLARQELQYLLDAAGDVSVLAQGTNGIEAVELIRTHKPDVIFLDVRMPGLDGFAVLKKVLALDRKMKLPQVVFATAFDQYAVKAFEVNAVDYLLKPFDSKRVNRTLEKVRERVANSTENAVEAVSSGGVAGETPGGRVSSRVAGAEAKLDALLRMVEERTGIAHAGSAATGVAGVGRTGKVVVRAQSRLLLVDQRDLCYATIEDGRISVVTKAIEGDSNCRTLEELTDQLDPEQFWRVHRSFVVNIQHIREVVPWFKSSYQLRMDDRKQTEVPVSRSQTKRLRELFNL
ncbi:MAG: LytTR family transcriptional regulator DNA-binding domain-containing protein [Acidobacteriaceae bacterium]